MSTLANVRQVELIEFLEQLNRPKLLESWQMECRQLVAAGWMYEDDLPAGYPYDAEFSRSRVVDGVRMFPPHVCEYHRSIDGGTELCKCGAWR